MPSNIGPNLLGRRVEKDPRDKKMADALKALETSKPPVAPPGDDILDKTVRDVIDEGIFFSSWQGLLAFWRWVKSFLSNNPTPSPVPVPDPSPVPVPTPTPVPVAVTSKVWNLNTQLDQGNTGHCVGFGWTSWENADPVPNTYDDPHAHAYYYDCKVIDNEPRQENGSTVRSGAKVAQNRKELNTYVFAASVDEVAQWVLNHGPVVIGTDWYNDMFNPTVNGFVTIGGGVAGGHCYILIGYDSETKTFLFQNSWGNTWGLGGRFKMTEATFAKLLSGDGEACAGTEIVL